MTPKEIHQIRECLKTKSIRETAKSFNITTHAVFKLKKNITVYKRGNLIQVNSVSDKLHKDLHNIADNLGVKFSEFMRKELKRIAENYPEKMKQPIKDY